MVEWLKKITFTVEQSLRELTEEVNSAQTAAETQTMGKVSSFYGRTHNFFWDELTGQTW